MTDAVDLSASLPVDTAVLHTVIPGTNKLSGWNVVFAGPGHPQTIALTNDGERKRLHRQAQIEAAQNNGRKWKGDDKKAPEDSRREFLTGIVARIVSWTPVNFGDGDVTFDEGDAAAPARAVMLLLNPRLGGYVAQFVDFLLDEKAFMTRSATD